MTYLFSLYHFRFHKEGESLIIRSTRNGFEEVYPWPDDWSLDDDLQPRAHEQFYLDVRGKYARRIE